MDTYEPEDAVRFIAERTPACSETVEQFLEAHFQYQEQQQTSVVCHSDDPEEEMTEVFCGQEEISTETLIKQRDYIAKKPAYHR